MLLLDLPLPLAQSYPKLAAIVQRMNEAVRYKMRDLDESFARYAEAVTPLSQETLRRTHLLGRKLGGYNLDADFGNLEGFATEQAGRLASLWKERFSPLYLNPAEHCARVLEVHEDLTQEVSDLERQIAQQQATELKTTIERIVPLLDSAIKAIGMRRITSIGEADNLREHLCCLVSRLELLVTRGLREYTSAIPDFESHAKQVASTAAVATDFLQKLHEHIRFFQNASPAFMDTVTRFRALEYRQQELKRLLGALTT